MKYQCSRWLHTYVHPEQDMVALLHTTRLELFHADREVLDLLRLFDVPQDLAVLAATYPDRATANQVLSTLVKYGYLIPEGTEEVAHWREQRTAQIDKQGAGCTTLIRIVLTEQCNLRCSYCFVDHQAKHMDVKMLFSVLDKLFENALGKHIEIQFFGGEPLLRFDLIKKAVKYISENHIKRGTSVSYSLTTNGTMITDEIAQFIKQHPFTICISLDGDKATNDINRIYRNGRGSYDQVIKGYKLLRKHGCQNVGFLLTPNISNTPTIADFFEYAIHEFHIDFFAINTPQPSLIGWGIDGGTYAEQLIRCYQFSQQNGVGFSSTLDKVIVALMRKREVLSSCFNPSGDRYALITASGEVSPCIVSWQPDFLQSLTQLNDPELFLAESYLDHPPACISCPALSMCGGPCYLEHTFMSQGGDWDHNRCLFFMKAIEWMVWNWQGTR